MTTVDSWPKTLPMMSAGSWNSTTETHLLLIYIWKWFSLPKGQIISKRLFGVFTFFPKTNENKSTSSKVEFVHSFFWKKHWLEKIISNLSDLYTQTLWTEIGFKSVGTLNLSSSLSLNFTADTTSGDKPLDAELNFDVYHVHNKLFKHNSNCGMQGTWRRHPISSDTF